MELVEVIAFSLGVGKESLFSFTTGVFVVVEINELSFYLLIWIIYKYIMLSEKK